MRIVLGLPMLACCRLGFESGRDAAEQPFALIETLTVPSDGSSAMSSSMLASAREYRVRASSVVTCGGVGDMMADAEYHDFTAPKDDNSLNGLDMGLSIDAPVVGEKVTRWGTYTATHVYEIDFAARDQPISVNFHDADYANNAGSFTLEILER